MYTRLIREEADPDEDRLGSAEKQEVEQGRQPPRDIFGLLEVDTNDAQGLVSPDQGSLFRIELPADEDEGNFTPLEDEFRMFELEENYRVSLNMRFGQISQEECVTYWSSVPGNEEFQKRWSSSEETFEEFLTNGGAKPGPWKEGAATSS